MTKPMLNYSTLIGLSEGANSEEVESRCQDLIEFLSSAEVPEGLRGWVDSHAALIDEALAELLDPDREARQALAAEAVAVPAAVASAATGRKSRTGTAETAKPVAIRPVSPESRGLGAVPRPALWLAAVVVLVLGGYGIYKYGSGGDDSGPSKTAQEAQQQQGDAVPIDPKRIAELKQIILKDPQNIEALFELGESYFQANRFQEAMEWEVKLLAIDPKNVHVQTDLGTSYFNLGKSHEAKAAWEAGLAIAPDDVQLHYNMGFLYANAEPRDVVSARKEWEKVLALAPNSELASVVKAHMGTMLSTPSSTPSASRTPSP